jgi:hypothetical protein
MEEEKIYKCSSVLSTYAKMLKEEIPEAFPWLSCMVGSDAFLLHVSRFFLDTLQIIAC